MIRTAISLLKRLSRIGRRRARQAKDVAAATAARIKTRDSDDGAKMPVRPAVRFWFKELPRPERARTPGEPVTLDEAKRYAAQFERSATRKPVLNPCGELFYEETERDELRAALGIDDDPDDAFFTSAIDKGVRRLNRNTRYLYLGFAPPAAAGALVAFLAAGHFFGAALASALGLIDPRMSALAEPLIALLSLASMSAALWLVFHWPYKMTQRNSVYVLDNFIQSEFSRIARQFDRSKQHAQTAEKERRLSQVEQLIEEANAWTACFHWQFQRALLYERYIRNGQFRIRRNTFFYALGGYVLSSIYIVAVIGVAWVLDIDSVRSSFGALAALLIVGAAAVVAGSGWILSKTVHVIQDNFNTDAWLTSERLDMPQAVKDTYVADKVQFVNYRDRMQRDVA
jgi:hypothetical protein